MYLSTGRLALSSRPHHLAELIGVALLLNCTAAALVLVAVRRPLIYVAIASSH
jgi:hypothetical protein